MIIMHNLSSINTSRLMAAENLTLSKSLGRLSSGYKINKAGDNAAGLTISEKMRGQIRGLNQASSNSQDAISLLQTADGALGETTNLLQRMRELAVQSANVTNTNNDRTNIQSEVTQLEAEIDRISTDTEFNAKKLLDGSMSVSGSGSAGGGTGLPTILQSAHSLHLWTGEPVTAANGIWASCDDSGNSYQLLQGAKINISGQKGGIALPSTALWAGCQSFTMDTAPLDIGVGFFKLISVFSNSETLTFSYDGSSYTANLPTEAYFTDLNTVVSDIAAAMNGAIGTSDITGTGIGTFAFSFGTDSGKAVILTSSTNTDLNNAITTSGTSQTFGGNLRPLSDLLDAISTMTGGTATITAGGYIQITGQPGTDNALSSLSLNVAGNALFNSDFGAFTEIQAASNGGGSTGSTANGGINIQIGANAGQSINIDISDMGAQALGVNGLQVTTQTQSDTAIDTIDTAIEKVSSERAKLGAFQNRLEHTINNLDTGSENLSDAESRIRDVDMAKEMMQYSKITILMQVSQAMLTQSSQQPQSVLQLLK